MSHPAFVRKPQRRTLTISLAVLAAALIHSGLHADERTFTSSSGTTIRGELDTINGDLVTTKKEDGKTITTRAANFSAADMVYLKEHGLKEVAPELAKATEEAPFVNSLGMKFVTVPGTQVLFCTTLTRAVDYDLSLGKTHPAGEIADYDFAQPKRLGALFPVNAVSWEKAKAFCDWLSKKEGRSYRLPTDREWSVAVGIAYREDPKATPENLDGKIKGAYPWGTQWPPPDRVGNYSDETFRAFRTKNSGKKADGGIKGFTDGEIAISPVEAFQENRLGLHDMGGNLWQWCEDWYDAGKSKKLLRGGY